MVNDESIFTPTGLGVKMKDALEMIFFINSLSSFIMLCSVDLVNYYFYH